MKSEEEVVEEQYPCSQLRKTTGDENAMASVRLEYQVTITDSKERIKRPDPFFRCADDLRCGVVVEGGMKWSLCPRDESPEKDT